MNGRPFTFGLLFPLILLGGCGPLGVGLGLNELFSDDPGPDLVNPTVSFLRESGAAVGPFETATSVTFRIVRNKSNVAVRALVAGPAQVADAGALDADGCPDAALFGPTINGGELTLTGLQDLSPYTVYLRGEDPDGRVDCTAHSFFVDTQAPASPVILRVEASKARELKISWLRPDDAGSGVAGYRVYYDVGGRSIPDTRVRVVGETYVPQTFLLPGLGGSARVPVVDGAETLSFTLKGLFACRMHYVQVTAIDAAGNESPLVPEREASMRTRAGGDGTFEAPYAVGRGGTHAGVGDVNGDGAPDVVVRDTTNKVKTAFGSLGVDGKPTRTFVVGDTFSTGSAMTMADIDGNARPDLVFYVGGSYSGDYGIGGLANLNPGQEGLLGGQTSAIKRVKLADLDRDGILDRIRSTGVNSSGSVGGTLSGGAEFSVDGPSNAFDFAFADFDGDGLGDIAATFQGSVRIALHSGQTVQVVVPTDPFGLAAADFDQDGIADIATANRDGSISVVLGKGDGTFGASWDVAVGTSAGRLTVGDFDEDLVPDLAVGDCLPNAVTILRGNGDGTFTNTQTIQFSNTICQVHVHDMTADTILDLVVLTPSDSYVVPCRGARGIANGKFHLTQEQGPGFHSAVAADFNDDLIPDIVGAGTSGPTVDRNYDGPISVTLGTGQGGEGIDSVGSRLTSTGDRSHWPLVGDFDGDGKLDVVSIGPFDAEFLRGLGNGGFESPVPYFDAGTSPRIRAYVDDLDRDGALDVIRGGGIHFGDLDNGERNAEVRDFIEIGGGIIAHSAVADINGDRLADLVAVTQQGRLELYYSNGDGTFEDPVLVSMFGEDLLSVYVVDIDGDPIPDLVLLDFESDLWVLRGKADANGFATGTFHDPVRSSLAASSHGHLWSAVSGDVDADGHADLLIAVSRTGDPIGSGNMVLLTGDGTGEFTQDPNHPSNGFNPLLIDLNRDRILDIVTGDDDVQRILTGSGVVVGD